MKGDFDSVSPILGYSPHGMESIIIELVISVAVCFILVFVLMYRP